MATHAAPQKDSIQKVIEGLILASLLWIGSTVVQLQTKTAVIQVQLADIQVKLAELDKTNVDMKALQRDVDYLKNQLGK